MIKRSVRNGEKIVEADTAQSVAMLTLLPVLAVTGKHFQLRSSTSAIEGFRVDNDLKPESLKCLCPPE